MQSCAAVMHLPRFGLSSCLPVTIAAALHAPMSYPGTAAQGLSCLCPWRGDSAEDGEPLSEPQPCPRVTQLRGHSPLLFCLFFSQPLSRWANHSLKSYRAYKAHTCNSKPRVQWKTVGPALPFKIWLMSSRYLQDSRYEMSPWWPTRALWSTVYVLPMRILGMQSIMEMQGTLGPIFPQPGHSIPSLELAKGTSLCHFYWLLYTGSHLAELNL